MPQAAAYFPLTSGNLSSAFPSGQYQGDGRNVVWRNDSQFGSVLACDETAQSYVSIPGLHYGQGGDWAVAFWVKPLLDNGTSFDYALSHTGARDAEPAFDPNEVAIFLPEQGHPDTGMVRAIVRDATDVRTNGSLPFFLDSNGCVSDPDCPNKPAEVLGLDAGWHLLGVTTQPGGGKGFQLYVDGQLAAQAQEGQLYTGGDGYPKAPTGGGPMSLTGNLTLCARSDLEPSRFFTGSLAHLFVYNTSLTAEQMQEIYQTGLDSMAAPNPTAGNTTIAGANTTAANTSTAGALHSDPASQTLPAADCVTPCEDFNGAATCFTSDNQERVCTPANSTSGGGAGGTALPITAATQPTAAPQAGSSFQPATDCVTACTQGALGSTWVCYNGQGVARSCLATSAGAATDPSLSSASPQVEAALAGPSGAWVPAAATNTSQQAAALLWGQPLCSPQPIQGVTTVQSCPSSYACAALSDQQLAENLPALPVQAGDIGVCAYAPTPLMLPAANMVPPPMAFFPLTSQSFPLAEYTGSAAGAGVAPDPLFGTALACTASDRDIVALNPVQYAAAGPFSVNLWFKPGNMSGATLSYLFSHRGSSAAANASANTGWQPNQIQVYLPNQQHPSYGVVRTYVKDSNDTPATTGAQSWLDSDGSIAFNDARNPAIASALYDGRWHMATVTSQPGGGRGYRLYLDGRLVNEVVEGSTYYSPEGFPIPIDGGDPMQLDGNVVLCGRSDDPSGRHFDGRLAYLGLYDQALDEAQVGLLYSAVRGGASPAAEAPTNTSAAAGEVPIISPQTAAAAGQLSVTGRPCVFPALYNGDMVTDCVPISGTLSCQVEEGVWEPCEGSAASLADPSATTTLLARYTVGGEECVFPAIYQGQALTDCATLEPGTPEMCQTASGTWAECASATLGAGATTAGQVPAFSLSSSLNAPFPASPAGSTSRAPVVTAHGGVCQLPLLYHGMQVDGCINIDAQYLCWGQDSHAWEACPADLMQQQPEPGALGVSAAAAALPVVHARLRATTSGDSCRLPTVYQGELLDDCVQRNGTWQCLTATGDWARCDLRGAQPPVSTGGQLLVAQRNTQSNASCLLPAVYGGYLWFDCIPYTDSSGTADICPTTEGGWDLCSDPGFLGMDLPDPQPLSASATLNRTQPGRTGMLCPVQPSAQPNQNCAANLTCVPLPELDVNSSVETGLEGLGFCTPRPAGGSFGVFRYLQNAAAPVPLAFFPLTSPDRLDSLLLPEYRGSPSGAPLPSWVADPTFNSSVNCSKDARNALQLETVPYATTGSFALSLWFRRLPGSSPAGDLWQYLYSHTGVASTSAQSPNTVAVYLADRGNPAYGTLRVIVTDENDLDNTLTYLDSDGQLDSMAGKRRPGHADLNDGGWHMVTVSTFPNDTRGYALYVDGQQARAGVAALSNATKLQSGGAADVTGGDPAQLSSDIFLCSRSDSDPDRFYGGSVAHLLLFNAALEPRHVAGLYAAYRSNNGTDSDAAAASASDPAAVSATAPADPSSGSSSGLSGGEIAGIVIASLGAAMAVATGLVMGASYYRQRTRSKRFERFTDDAFAATAFHNAEAGLPPGGGAGGSAGAAAPRAAGAAFVPAPLSIQLSSGKSLSVGSKDLDSATGSETGSHAPRFHSELSDISDIGEEPGLVPGAAPASHAPTATTVPAPTRPSEAVPDSPFDDGGSATSARGSDLGSGGVSIEPGKRGLFKRAGARVVLPPAEEDGVPSAATDPRGPLDP